MRYTDRPNVLFVVCDDLNHALPGHDRIPVAPAPNVARLMRRGTTFRNAQNNCPICLPSRNSFLTGLYPHTTGHYRLWDRWQENEAITSSVPLPLHLRRNGYESFGAGKTFHNGMVDESYWTRYGPGVDYGPFPTDGSEDLAVMMPSQEFLLHAEYVSDYCRQYNEIDPFVLDGQLRFEWEHGFGPLSEVPDIPPDPTRGIPGYTGWRNMDRSHFHYVDETTRDRMADERTADWAIDVLHEDHAAPFFLAAGFIRPHTPLYVPDPFFESIPLEDISFPPVLDGDLDDCASALIGHCPYGFTRYQIVQAGGKEMWRRWLQAYLASVAFMDHQLGRVLDALEKSPYADNTIVVFTSDNGFHMGEKEYLFKDSLWEESARVPLIVASGSDRVASTPGIAHGAVCDQPVSLIDLYPTLIDVCDVAGHPHAGTHGLPLDGHSLAPLLADPAAGVWSGPPVALTSSKELTGLHHTVRSATHRYTLCENGEEELYDHRSDPMEWHNLAADHAHVALKAQLRDELEALLAPLD